MALPSPGTWRRGAGHSPCGPARHRGETRAADWLPAVGVEVIEFDDRSDLKEAVNVAKLDRGVRPAVVAIIVALQFPAVRIPASRVYAQAGNAHDERGVPPTLSSPAGNCRRNGGGRGCLANTTDDAQASTPGIWCLKPGSGKIRRCHPDKTANQGIEGISGSALPGGGRNAGLDVQASGQGISKPCSRASKRSRPEAIFYGGTFTGALILRQARELGFPALRHRRKQLRSLGLHRHRRARGGGAYVTYPGPPCRPPAERESVR